jgi:hypothetical protein
MVGRPFLPAIVRELSSSRDLYFSSVRESETVPAAKCHWEASAYAQHRRYGFGGADADRLELIYYSD